MGLTDAQRVRYARHLLLPELGEPGQARLLAGAARPAAGADARALEVARDYLSRAGLRIATQAGEAAVALPLPSSADVLRLAGTPELAEAARALAGAFAAVEAIKAAAELGTPGALPADFSLASEEA